MSTPVHGRPLTWGDRADNGKGKGQVTSQRPAANPAIAFHPRAWSGLRSLNSNLHVQVIVKGKFAKIGK